MDRRDRLRRPRVFADDEDVARRRNGRVRHRGHYRATFSRALPRVIAYLCADVFRDHPQKRENRFTGLRLVTDSKKRRRQGRNDGGLCPGLLLLALTVLCSVSLSRGVRDRETSRRSWTRGMPAG